VVTFGVVLAVMAALRPMIRSSIAPAAQRVA